MKTNDILPTGEARAAERDRISDSETADAISRLERATRGKTALNVVDVRRIAGIAHNATDAGGRGSQKLTEELQRIEREHKFTPAAGLQFQNLLGKLGIDSDFQIRMPVDDRPYWLRKEHRLTAYRSSKDLPLSADVVVVGAGLTGASAAYHLSKAATQAPRIVVLDRGAPGGEASGRNGGNFELLPENSVGIYEGLARERQAFLHRRYPAVPKEIVRIESERQASIIFGVALRNRDLMKRIIEQENIDCDFSPRGWLFLAHTENEEQAICDEVVLAAQQRQKIEIWSRNKIKSEFGFQRNHIGRFIPGDGSYHPFKFVCGLLERCLASGVELYTGVKVREVRTSSESRHSVITDDGTIIAGKVIVATNAFASQIFPELGSIRPTQSQVTITEFAADRCRGRIVTSEEGPVYFNQPRNGARSAMAPLLMGGGPDRSVTNPSSRRRSAKIHAKLLRLRERFFPELKKRPYQAVNRQISDAIAFSPEGTLPSKGTISPVSSDLTFRLSEANRTSASSIDPKSLRSLPVFTEFTLAECQELLRMTRRLDLPGGTLLFRQGSPGRSCFVVLSGSVNVSMRMRGQDRLLSTLHSGSIFGQIALIEGSLRTATCGAAKSAVLLEIEQDACRRLFAMRSPTALKFLGALNQGLIWALRGADRHLMRLTLADGVSSTANDQRLAKMARNAST